MADQEREELKKYAEMFISMSIDYIAGGLSREAYLSNIQLAADNLKKFTSKEVYKAKNSS